MKSIELLGLLIKVMSVLLLMLLLQATSETLSLYLSGYFDDVEVTALVVLPLVYCVLGFFLFLVLWNFPISVAKLMLPRSSDENYPILNFEKDALELIVYSGIGVLLLATYIPNFAYDLLYFVLLDSSAPSIFSENRDTIESLLQMMYSALMIFMGIVLCFFSGEVKRIIHKFRGRT